MIEIKVLQTYKRKDKRTKDTINIYKLYDFMYLIIL